MHQSNLEKFEDNIKNQVMQLDYTENILKYLFCKTKLWVLCFKLLRFCYDVKDVLWGRRWSNKKAQIKAKFSSRKQTHF